MKVCLTCGRAHLEICEKDHDKHVSDQGGNKHWNVHHPIRDRHRKRDDLIDETAKSQGNHCNLELCADLNTILDREGLHEIERLTLAGKTRGSRSRDSGCKAYGGNGHGNA